MRCRLVLAAFLLANSPAQAKGAKVELSAIGWFFGIRGHIEDSNLNALDFEAYKGQPELVGAIRLDDRHHFELSYLRVRRRGKGTAQVPVFDVFTNEERAWIDLGVDYLRGHYGYSFIFMGGALEVQPFFEVANLAVKSFSRTQNSYTSPKNESEAFPLPGVEVSMDLTQTLVARGKFAGIGTGYGHLLDFEAAVERALGSGFARLGYRFVDFRFDTDGNPFIPDSQHEVDVQFDGVFVEGGIRF